MNEALDDGQWDDPVYGDSAKQAFVKQILRGGEPEMHVAYERDVAPYVDISGDSVPRFYPGSSWNGKVIKRPVIVIGDEGGDTLEFQYFEELDRWLEYGDKEFKDRVFNYGKISKEDRSGNLGLSEVTGQQAAPMAGAGGQLRGMGSSAWSSGGAKVLAAPKQHVPIDPEEDEYTASLDWGFYGTSR